MRRHPVPAWLAIIPALLIGVLLGTALLAPASATPTPTPNVSAYDTDGRLLGPDPALVSGQTVAIIVTGYVPSSGVTVELPGVATPSHLTANSVGDVLLVYAVPATLANGQYAVTFLTDPPPTQPPESLQPFDTTVTANVAVTIPALGVFPFVVDNTPPTSPSPSSTSTSGTATVSASSTRRPSPSHSALGVGIGRGHRPAFTGTDLAEPLLIAVIALVLGLGITFVARRRRAH